MNVKDFLLSLLFVTVITFSIQYLFRGNAAEDAPIKSGKMFVAPATQKIKPVNVEIDFIDTPRVHREVISEVETEYALFTFSSDGAALQRLIFKEQVSGTRTFFTTIYPQEASQREQKTFLVACNEQTPYYYELVDQKETDDAIHLVYAVQTELVAIQKTFVIHKQKHQVDLDLAVHPKTTEPIQARIFYQAPQMPEIAKEDTISAIVNAESGSIKKIARAKIDGNAGWYLPTIFGAENKYFVHAMVQDAQRFTQRAYYQLYGHQGVNSILEGPEISEKQQWTVSFYMGPKTDDAIAQVDPRLEQVLSYSGFLAPLSKFLLSLLKWIYQYIPNYGWAIIILTAVIKLLLIPLSINAEKSAKQQAEMEKKIQHLKQRYKNDPETFTREKAEVIRKHGLPGMLGCLPLLLQIPIFMALSRVLSSSIELYQAPFIGWIRDLSTYDPYYGIPLIIVIAMIVHALYANKMQRAYLIMGGLVMGAVTTNLAAGLALYIMVNTVLGVVQVIVQQKVRWA
jgi:YidC/Oxa1 family membrane protein insertase